MYLLGAIKSYVKVFLKKVAVGNQHRRDGFCEKTNTVYESHGCFYHGCPTCYPDDKRVKHQRTKQSMSELYPLTLRKKTSLKELGYLYICMWDHEFRNELSNNEWLSKFVKSVDVRHRLEPRDIFSGWRVNAATLHSNIKEGETIEYVDFTSLYPAINQYDKYMVRHPQIIFNNFKSIDIYFGLAKVAILPPKGLFYLLLLYKFGGKLLFGLCRTCMESESTEPCTCNDADHTMHGTFCTPELQKAVELGYKIIKIYEVYHWDETTQYNPVAKCGGLFAGYMNMFLKIKQEASGWLPGVDHATRCWSRKIYY